MTRSALLSLLCTAAVIGPGCDRTVAGGQADGAAVYRAVCARCHGRSGVPSPSLAASLGVRDLTAPAVHRRLHADGIRDQILYGSANGRMPGFAAILSQAQLDALVAYVSRLGQRPTAPPPAP